LSDDLYDENMQSVVVSSGYVNNMEFCYKMTHRRRGKLIVISNHYFLPESPMAGSPRHGTEYDVENLRLTFNELGFDCEVHEDKTCAEMLGIFIGGMKSINSRKLLFA